MTILQQMIFKKSTVVSNVVGVVQQQQQQQQRRCCASIANATVTRFLLNGTSTIGSTIIASNNKYSPSNSTRNYSRCSYSTGTSTCSSYRYDNDITVKASTGAVVVSSSSSSSSSTNHQLQVLCNQHQFLQQQPQLHQIQLGTTTKSMVRSMSTSSSSSSNFSPTSTSSSIIAETTTSDTTTTSEITNSVEQQQQQQQKPPPEQEQATGRSQERKTAIHKLAGATIKVAFVSTVVLYTFYYCLNLKFKIDEKFAEVWNIEQRTTTNNNNSNINSNNNENNTTNDKTNDTTNTDSNTSTGTEIDPTDDNSSWDSWVRNDEDATTNKKNVLVLPFYRMKIIEQYYNDDDQDITIERIKKIIQKIKSFINQLKMKKNDNDSYDMEDNNEIITIELNELIHLIHTAANDSTIVGIYGIFGQNGSNNALSSLGWGQLEELRTALRVFNECYRIHKEPNINYNNNNNEQRQQQQLTHQQLLLQQQHQELLQQLQQLQQQYKTTDTTTTTTTIPFKKFMYAYSENFASNESSSNKEYYIASIFNTIHMQKHSELNLYGPVMQSIFIYELLEKYNIKTNVFKHGQYKNAVNTITHTMYDIAHRTNVTSLLYEINKDVCTDIYTSRFNKIYNNNNNNYNQSSSTSKKQGTGARTTKKQNSITMENDDEYGTSSKINNDTIVSFWNRMYDIGTFTADHATKIGLIDHTSHRNPLYDLILKNKKLSDTQTNDSTTGTSASLIKHDDSTTGTHCNTLGDTCKDIGMPGWANNETDLKQFNADAIVTVKQYQELQKRKLEINKPKWYEKWLSKVDDKIIEETKNNRIIVLHLSGGIDDKAAFKFTHTLRKLRNNIIQNKLTDVKCIIVRVSSPGGSINACEMISQELQSLQKPMPNNINGIPLIVSFGDVAASGGYYISAYADRIFANSKTITGSIGVFGVRIDLSQLAKQYGITVDQVMTGPLSSTNNSLIPMTDKQKSNVMNSINRAYEQFTSIVATGRTLPISYVQDALGAGRVWTGSQGKTNGLVDEIGGIYRAIAYAKRTYCDKDITDKDIIVQCIQGSNNTLLFPNPGTSYSYNISNDTSIGDNYVSFIFTILYNYIVDFITGTTNYSNIVNDPIGSTQSLQSSLSGIYLTVDDNTALRLLLQQNQQQLHGNPFHTQIKILNENPYITKSFWE